MQFNKDEVVTNRLILRRFQPGDYEDYCELLTQREVNKWLGNGKEITSEQAKKTMDAFERAWDKYGYGVWAVVHKEDNKVIGQCGFYPIANTTEIELLYALSPKYWGHGYASEAAEAAIAYAKEVYKWNSLSALAYNDNKGSINVLTKQGFKYIENQEHFGASLAYFKLDL